MKKISLLKKSLIALVILGFLFIHFYAPRFITEIRNPLSEFIRPKLQVDSILKLKEKGRSSLSFEGFDKTKLNAIITYSQLDTSYGTIILLHGIRSNKEHFFSLSDQLASAGFAAVALDLRAHGESEGKYCTYGVKEKKDVSALITELIQSEKLNKTIGVWGQSLGGAIGLQTMAIDPRIKFGIIESTFTDFRTITHDYFKFNFGFNISPLTNYLIYRAGIISDFDPEEAKPSKYCKNIIQPILLVHGNKDRRIDIRYARENFNNIPGHNKEFLEIDQANHVNVWTAGGTEYFSKVFRFIKNKSATLDRN